MKSKYYILLLFFFLGCNSWENKINIVKETYFKDVENLKMAFCVSYSYMDGGKYIIIGEKGEESYITTLTLTEKISSKIEENDWIPITAGKKSDIYMGIKTQRNIGLILTGSSYNFSNASGRSIMIVRIDDEGNIIGNITPFKLSEEEKYNEVRDVLEMDDGDLIIVGTKLEERKDRVFLMKLSITGELKWEKVIKSSYKEEGKAIARTQDGESIFVGCNVFIENSIKSKIYKLTKTEDSLILDTTFSKEVFSNSSMDSISSIVRYGNTFVVIGNKIEDNYNKFYIALIENDGNINTNWLQIDYPTLKEPVRVKDCFITSAKPINIGNFIGFTGYYLNEKNNKDAFFMIVDSKGEVKYIKLFKNDKCDIEFHNFIETDFAFYLIGASYDSKGEKKGYIRSLDKKNISL